MLYVFLRQNSLLSSYNSQSRDGQVFSRKSFVSLDLP